MSSGSSLIKFMVLAIGIILLSNATNGDSITLIDFTSVSNLDNWSEQSDTVRSEGKSKATLVLEKTRVFQRAIFFTLLNLLPSGAAFAGMRTQVAFNLSAYENITIKCRAQGNNSHYKIVLRHENLTSNADPTYEAFFKVSTHDKEFQTVNIPLTDFKAYFRGQAVPNAKPLNTANITIFGLQMFAGVYLPVKQSGVSSLEIDTIGAAS